MNRVILHVDMDAFFASIEQRDHPEYQNQPVVIGGLSARGVVSTASYEARTFGVHSAMPMAQARRLCPQAIFLTPNMKLYHQVSEQLMDILGHYSPLVEPISVDEAFIDVSGSGWLYRSPREIAQQIKKDIREQLHLTASAGISYNKFLAKLASDLNKPDGLTIIPSHQLSAIVHPLPIRKLWGIGQKSATVLTEHGIHTIGDLAHRALSTLEPLLGNQACTLQQLAQGIDHRLVESNRAPKSFGHELTFEQDVTQSEQLQHTLLNLADQVTRRLRRERYQAKTITLKVRFAPFQTVTRSVSFMEPCDVPSLFYQQAVLLLQALPTKPVRLIGLSASHLCPRDEQVSLFSSFDKEQRLMDILDKLHNKPGTAQVIRLSCLRPLQQLPREEHDANQ